MANAFGISLDYLVGNAEQAIDKQTLQRLQSINNLSEENKKMVFQFLDAFITKTKLEAIL